MSQPAFPATARPSRSIGITACILAAALLTGCLTESGDNTPKNPKRLFVTSTTHTGNLGGLAGADSICEARATGAGLDSGWTAFLSDSLSPAPGRVAEAGAWTLVHDRTIVFRDLYAPVFTSILDEHGQPVPDGSRVWTGTLADGTADLENLCSNWTSSGQESFGAAGDPLLVTPDDSPRWMYLAGALRCASPAHLYCMEQ